MIPKNLPCFLEYCCFGHRMNGRMGGGGGGIKIYFGTILYCIMICI